MAKDTELPERKANRVNANSRYCNPYNSEPLCTKCPNNLWEQISDSCF